MEPDRSVHPGAGNRGWLGEDGTLHVLGAWSSCYFQRSRETPFAAELMLGARTGSQEVLRRWGALPLEHLRATRPALRHPAPCRLARRIAGKLRHLLALCGMSEEFFRWIHEGRRMHAAQLLADRQAIRRGLS